MKTIKTRREAANSGEVRYYTGRPCRNGHETFRYTSTGNCSACSKDRAHQFSEQVRTAMQRKQQGLVLIELCIYEQDAERLRNYALALRTSRELSLLQEGDDV